MTICEKEKCTGCFACVNSCPKKCIEMTEDEIGHIYPVINDKICIDCGICHKSCPINSKPSKVQPKKVLAAYILDSEEHKTSTSGGVAAGFSKHFIEKGGIVYGASSKIKNGISHIRVDNFEDLKLLKGSKYVQSHINNTFALAQEDLKAGKPVLFTGTPCQIAGLRGYLKKDYENLLTVDLICHGVPPQKLLFEHLKKYTDAETTVSFRETDGFFLKLEDKNKQVRYRKKASRDLYFSGFNKNLFLRDSCYNCDYAQINRCSDITIGDFWGLGKKIPFDNKTSMGISVVLPNTLKGVEFWNGVSNRFFFEERYLDEAISGNHNLNMPTVKNKKYSRFIRIYLSRGFKKACISCMGKDMLKTQLFECIRKNKLLLKLGLKLRKYL